MSIFSELRVRIFLLIVMCCVFTFTLLGKGYCDDWVYVDKDKSQSNYYNKSNIIINKETKQIKVWTKGVYTNKGKKDFIKLRQFGVDVSRYKYINHIIVLELYDYDNMRYKFLSVTLYSTSGVVLDNSEKRNVPWYPIKPGSSYDNILNKILSDYNIRK